MESLEAANPDVTFVYATSSASPYGSAAGYNRFLMNKRIREYCLAGTASKAVTLDTL